MMDTLTIWEISIKMLKTVVFKFVYTFLCTLFIASEGILTFSAITYEIDGFLFGCMVYGFALVVLIWLKLWKQLLNR